MILRSALLSLAASAAFALPSAAGDAGPPVLKLLDPGREPRAPLRYAPRFGFDQVITMKVAQKMESSVAGRPIPTPQAPSFVMKMTVKIDRIDENGDVCYSASVDGVKVDADVQVPPQAAEMYQKMARSVNGSQATVTIDARGIVKESKVTAAPGADPQLGRQVTDQFTRLAMPLPEEPVGPGAKWSYTTEDGEKGASMRVVSTVTLGEEPGPARSMTMKIDGEVLVASAQMSVGTKIGGGGKAEWTSEKVAPIAYAQKITTSTEMPAGPQKMSLTTTAQVKMKSRE